MARWISDARVRPVLRQIDVCRVEGRQCSVGFIWVLGSVCCVLSVCSFDVPFVNSGAYVFP